ncbi:MAG: lytic transglycosylase domain-containing protein, partial [Pseudobdellovibrionaceae bacterium]
MLFAVVFLTSCATRQGLNDQDVVVQDPETPFIQINDNITSYRANENSPPQVVNEELETIPVEMNPLVEKWVNYFQGRGRPHMERYLARSNRYIGLMKKILRQNGLPEDLIYIALIESGFSSKATSRAAAVGYWQFIRPTGKRYGLEINSLVDERRDPVLSTQAAAEYFKGLYSVFGSWYLAMASYNVGENRVKREVMNHYTRDFWELARKKRFPQETINYVPKYIA